MDLFNQFSYVFISLGVLAASLLVLRYFAVDRRVIAAAATALIVLSSTGYLVLRPGAGDVDSISSADALIQNGKPTFMEFFSNYCAGCLAVRPVVDTIAASLGDDFNILRVDIHTDAGRELRERFQFSYTPEFLLLDSAGAEIWRGHTPPDEAQLAAAQQRLVGMENP